MNSLNVDGSLVNQRNEEIVSPPLSFDNPNQGLKGFLSSLDFPVPKFVQESEGVCPNWILPLDQLSFGVEVEVYDVNGVQNDVGVYHSDQRGYENVYCNFLPSFNGNKWKVEEDGSLDLDGGKEFISPILKGSEGIENVVEVLKILKSKGFQVNDDCGLHIHVGLSSICGNNNVDEVVSFLSRLVKSMFNYQGSLYGSCGSRRRDQEYFCSRLRSGENLIIISSDIEKKEKGEKNLNDFDRLGIQSDKYRCLNISNIRNGVKGERSSLEFRYPSGSLDPVQFLLHIVQIVWIVRQSWVDRHNKKGSDSVCNNWVLDKGFQKDFKNEGVKGYKFLSRKIKNSIRGKWLEYENPSLNYHWNDIFELWENQSKEYDLNYDV